VNDTPVNGAAASGIHFVPRRPSSNGHGAVKGAGWPEREPRKRKPRERLPDLQKVVPQEDWPDHLAAYDFLNRKELKAIERVILFDSVRVAWETGVFNQSIPTTMEKLCLTKSVVEEARMHLQQLGLWQFVRESEDGNHYYQLMMPLEWY